MRIGVDIDGCITDVGKFQLEYGSKFYFEKYHKSIQNHKGYEISNIFQVSEELDDEFWKKYFLEYSKNTTPRGFVSEVMKKLKEDGNELYIITARGNYFSHSGNVLSYEENKKVVLNWLEENNVIYDKIIFSPEDKLQICKENNIDLMIEDKPRNVEMISQEIPVICFHNEYNENIQGENIIRCYSWYDIYSKICSLKNFN